MINFEKLEAGYGIKKSDVRSVTKTMLTIVRSKTESTNSKVAAARLILQLCQDCKLAAASQEQVSQELANLKLVS